jgi:hypothetical protein
MDAEDLPESAEMFSLEHLTPVAIPQAARLGLCRSVQEFEKLNRVGEGTYGVVCL